jgi:hypothetical protein
LIWHQLPCFHARRTMRLLRDMSKHSGAVG